MLSHAAIVESARCISHEGGACSADVMLIVMPLFHIGGRIEQLSYTIVGATIVLHGAFDATAILRSIEAERVTSAHLAPIMVQRLLDSADLASTDKSRLRSIHYASAPMPVPTLRRAIAAFGPILTQMYGMTECIVASLLTPAQHSLDGSEAAVKRLGSAGQAFLGCSIRILRTDGADAATGEIGEILVRGPGMMNGYWNNTTATVSTLRDGWMHTGDLGYLDADNFIFVVDRKKDMIISGGENIYSWEVEEALRSHPAVAEAAVIGVPDAEWGEFGQGVRGGAPKCARIGRRPDRPLPVADRKLQETANGRVRRGAAALVQRQGRQEGIARAVPGARRRDAPMSVRNMKSERSCWQVWCCCRRSRPARRAGRPSPCTSLFRSGREEPPTFSPA